MSKGLRALKRIEDFLKVNTPHWKQDVGYIEKEMVREGCSYFEIERATYNVVKLEEPEYVVELTNSEFQLISFYLELEKRKPIMNVELNAELKKER